MKVRLRGARARARPRASANRAGAAQRGDNCWRTGPRRQSQERAHNVTSRRRPFALLALVSVRPPFSTRRQTRRAYWAVPPRSRPAKRDAHRTHLLVKQASNLLNHRRSPRLPSNSVPILGCALSHSPTPLIGVKCRCLLLLEDTDGAINTQHPASPRMGIGFASTNGSADWVAASD